MKLEWPVLDDAASAGDASGVIAPESSDSVTFFGPYHLLSEV
jgi:hypothetical protein